MANDICSSRQCNVCLVTEMEHIPARYEDADEKVATSICLKYITIGKCSGCQLVVYCTQDHQKTEWPIHRDFCRAAQKLMSTYNVKHPYLIGGQPTNAEEMERSIIQVKFVLSALLERPLHYHEDELTSFPQYCEVCYSLRRLRICGRCQAVSYCSEEHAIQDEQKHNRKCALLQLYYCAYKAQTMSPVVFELYQRVPELHKTDLFEAFQRATLKQLPKQPTATFLKYKLFATAADFSCIGTICYVLSFTEMRSYDKKKFVIFIVGAVFDQELWFKNIHTQFFFLQFPQITQLHLYFIGPEVEGPDTHECKYEFKGQECCIYTVTYRGLFQDFSKEHNIKPSLIISFNCGFSENMSEQQKHSNLSMYSRTVDLETGTKILNEDTKNEMEQLLANQKDTWTLGILDMLLTFDVPIAFTSYNSLEAQFDYATVLRIAQSEDQPIYVSRILNVKRNPFRDLRPLRHWRLCDDNDDGIFYRNGYVQALCTRFET